MKYTIKNAAISLNGNSILNEVNFEVIDGNHIGIVGRNGAGKTTLLKALIHPEMFEEGINETPFEINKIGTFSIGYLEQISFEDENTTLLEEIQKSFQEVILLEEKLEHLLKQMEENYKEKVINEYTKTLDQFTNLGGYTYKKEYEIILKKFGFTSEDKEKKISDFSGGERTKIAFIKLLLLKPDLLILDEPTNHLDIGAIEWLENYLKNYKGAFLIVSHDRMFLNNTVNCIYDISYGKTTKYIGNYETFVHQKKANYEQQLKDYERQQKEIARLKSLYEKFRYKPTKASMALSKLHMIERMEKILKPMKENEKTFKMNLKNMELSGKTVLTCKDLVVGYNLPLATFNFEVIQGQRIGIIGENGTGKSTFLKTINNKLKPLKGTYTYGYHVKIGYFDQNLEMENQNHTVLEEFKTVFPEALDNEARNALGAFLFSGEDVNKKVSVLSGGEKVRLELCKVLYKKPNVLLLDEPTNHMDIYGKQQLENILESYKGTILFVSHDRYFVKKMATDLIVFENNQAKIYPYSYETYLEKREEAIKPTLENNGQKKNKSKKENTLDIKKQIAKLEKEITKLEEEKQSLNEELYKEENYTDYQKIAIIKRNLEEIEAKLINKEQEWENRIKNSEK